jgi:hypothetical protein
MFSPLNLFSSASNPIPCPALLENQLCPIPRCLFSHDVKPAPPPPAPPPLPEAVVTTVNNAPPVAVDNPEPPKPPPPLSATEKRLREIVEGKTQDVAVGRRQSKSPDQGGSTQLLTDDGPPTKRRASASTASIRPADTPEELASLSAWPTPAQSMGKKATAPKGGGVSLGEFYETQVSVTILLHFNLAVP